MGRPKNTEKNTENEPLIGLFGESADVAQARVPIRRRPGLGSGAALSGAWVGACVGLVLGMVLGAVIGMLLLLARIGIAGPGADLAPSGRLVAALAGVGGLTLALIGALIGFGVGRRRRRGAYRARGRVFCIF
jgi:hypothetical protein